MTNKKQPEPLSLADEADTADDAGHTTARTANAYYLCLLSDCSQMIRRLHAEVENLALYKNLADEYGLSIFKDLKDLTTEIEDLREKLKTYEAQLYTAPQPSPAAQGDALDAERLDWLTFNLSGKALRDIGVVWSEHGDARRAIDAARTAQEGASHEQAPAQAASSAVLKAIREANMQLVRTGDDAFMLVPYKAVTAQAAESVPAGPRRKDMLWATAKMQERHDQRIENIVSGLERIK